MACGFQADDTALVYDATGHFDTFTLTSVSQSGGTMVVNAPASAGVTTYKTGSTIVKAVSRTYSLKADAATNQYQLVSYDGGSNADTPVAGSQPPGPDVRVLTAIRKQTRVHEVNLRCERGAVHEQAAVRPRSVFDNRVRGGGELRVRVLDPVSGLQVPRLAVLGGDPSRRALILLTPAQLTDGPWCPDAGNTG